MKESIDKEWNLATLERTKIFPEEDAIELIQDRFYNHTKFVCDYGNNHTKFHFTGGTISTLGHRSSIFLSGGAKIFFFRGG